MAECVDQQAASAPTAQAVPASLRQLASQIKEADEFGVAPDLVRDADELVEAAWSGTLSEPVVGRKIRLADAIQRSSTVLDAASRAYIRRYTAEMRALAGNAFQATEFTEDTLKSFKSLKDLDFEGLGTIHYNLIHSALTQHEVMWCDSHSPLNDEVKTIQLFCMRVEAITESTKDRTGHRIANDEESPRKRLITYNSEENIIHSREMYPKCVEGPFDWANLFAAKAGDGEDGPWLTPRMAARLHFVALDNADSMISDFEEDKCSPPLPRIARPFFKKSKEWRESFRDCYVRIAMRLQLGLPPQPNCTGEELAFRNILVDAQDRANDEMLDDNDDDDDDDDDSAEDDDDMFKGLPKYSHDYNFDLVSQISVKDEDVLMLYEEGDDGYSDSDGDETRVDNPVLGKNASLMLGASGALAARMGAVFIHPGEWFIAFKVKDINNHLPAAKS